MTLFSAERLSFHHPGHPPSLLEASFQIRSGERIALLGANGSGKSTLLFLLGGLLFASEGSLEAFGELLTERRLEKDPFFRQQVGILFQNSDAQLFCPTVEEEIAFGPLQLGLKDTKTRLEEVLELLGIETLRKRSPHQLSGGEKKRVALASILVLNPSVLLLDEPLSGLDPRTQRELLGLLEGLSERGTTLVTSTHDLGTIPRIADRALVLGEDHRLVKDGKAPEILSDRPLLEASNLV